MKLKHLFTLVCVVIATALFTGCFGGDSGYKPWQDMSDYFDLDQIQPSGSMYHFNSYDLGKGKIPYRNERLNDNEYTATVLGLNVLLRSDRIISPRTRIGSVNTGDMISVQSRSEYSNGKFWNYVYVSSGPYAGRSGYICTDFLIGQDQYEALRKYVFSPKSNILPNAESKYLNAISAILLKLNVNDYNPNLLVDVIDVDFWAKKTVVSFRIHDINLKDNASLLAFVEFTSGENDYTVFGIVPGSNVRSITPCPNGSYDVIFEK